MFFLLIYAITAVSGFCQPLTAAFMISL
ncbi:hypothetical protein CK3_23940 [butyrate-producing bacterium SS3/4]|nr:hypothetical protein CK3_23940 [butyrate-producing bacterium SS3/4]